VCVPLLLFLFFLRILYALLHLHRFKTYIWYQSEVIGFKGMPLLLGFNSFLIEQVYLGFVINLVSVGVLWTMILV
jgi:hypothetical protein